MEIDVISVEGKRFEREVNLLSKWCGDKIWEKLSEMDGVMIAGGILLRAFTGRKLHDLDLYFYSYLEATEFTKWLTGDSEKAEKVFSSDNAETYVYEGKTIQIINRFYGNPSDILKTFDFTVCQVIYMPYKKMWFYHKHFFVDNTRRQLVMNPKMPYPIASLYRVVKYMKYGYNLSGIQSIILGTLCSKINIETMADAKEQFMGVDMAVLSEYFEILEKDTPLDKITFDLIKWMENAFEAFENIRN